MSAAPRAVELLPEPIEEPAGSDADGFALLEAIRRRVDDQATLGRKTQQQVVQLAESIGALVEVQRRRTRSLNLNSFVAYLIFTVLCGAGAFLLYRARSSELVVARVQAERARDAAVREADAARTAATARAGADAAAWSVWELLEAGHRPEAAAKLDSLAAVPLSRTERAVLAAKAHETQVADVDATVKAAAAALKQGKFMEVIAPLEAALVVAQGGPKAGVIEYYLGIACSKAGQLDRAVQHFKVAVVADAEHDDARFYLASALDRAKQPAEARAEYSKFAGAHPGSPYAGFAARRAAVLAKTAGAAAPGVGSAGGAGGAGGAGARPAVDVPPSGRGAPAGLPPAAGSSATGSAAGSTATGSTVGAPATGSAAE